jgi:hypothetical protein
MSKLRFLFVMLLLFGICLAVFAQSSQAIAYGLTVADDPDEGGQSQALGRNLAFADDPDEGGQSRALGRSLVLLDDPDEGGQGL